MIGGAFSAADPFGGVAKAGFFMAPAVAGGLNSASSNLVNQGLNYAARDAEFNGVSLGASAAGGFIFGAWYGTTSAKDLGIPVQGTMMQAVAKGSAGGFASGAAGTFVSF